MRQLRIRRREHVCSLSRKGALDNPELEHTWLSTYTCLNLSSNSQMSPKPAFPLTSPDATEPLNTSEQPFAWSPWRRQWHPLKCSRPENPMDGAAGSSSDCKEKRRQSKGSKDRKSSRWKALRQSTPAQSGTGKPGVLQSMGSQSVGHDWATELNWCSVCPPW